MSKDIVAEGLQKRIHIDRRLVKKNFGCLNGLVIHEVKAHHGLRSDQASGNILP
jgi:hypothetical protein